jgi:SAM-dependent methyltransferase
MQEIDKLLNLVPEKYQWRRTTSKKFKKDVFDFFNKPTFKELNCLEIGCAHGHTTLILSKLFKKVYGINNISTEEAKQFCNNNNCENVEFFNQDVYVNGLPNIEADVIMIDAVHTYEAVKMDIHNSLKLKSNYKKHLIFDDTGIEPPVLKAVNDFCDNNILKIITKIGHKPGDFFHRELYSEEGLICIEL